MYGQNAFIGLNDGQGSLESPAGGGKGGNYYRGRFSNVTRVKGLQAFKDIDGQMGMCTELNTSDQGGTRSSMSYFEFADTTSTLWGLTALTSGLISPSSTSIKGLLPRLKISQAFAKLADSEGYDSCAKNDETKITSSETWKSTTSLGLQSMITARRSAAQIIIDKIEAA